MKNIQDKIFFAIIFAMLSSLLYFQAAEYRAKSALTNHFHQVINEREEKDLERVQESLQSLLDSLEERDFLSKEEKEISAKKYREMWKADTTEIKERNDLKRKMLRSVVFANQSPNGHL